MVKREIRAHCNRGIREHTGGALRGGGWGAVCTGEVSLMHLCISHQVTDVLPVLGVSSSPVPVAGMIAAGRS